MSNEEKKQKIGSILYKYRRGITKENVNSITEELIEII